MTVKERIYREWLALVMFVRIIVIFVQTFVHNAPFLWLKFILFIYALTMLQLRYYIDEIHRGDNPVSSWFWLPSVCLLLIEPLNQFTFYYAKKQRQRAIFTKAIIFWSLFTIYNISDIIIRLQAEQTSAWIFSKEWSEVIILFLISAIAPWYSFCPDIRFFLLHGKFEIGKKTRQEKE